MKLRIFTEPQQGASYATLRAVALAAEELGFDAFFRSDHYLAMGQAGRPVRPVRRVAAPHLDEAGCHFHHWGSSGGSGSLAGWAS